MLTLVGGFVFQRLRTPNACVLGSLAVAIPLTAAERFLGDAVAAVECRNC